MEFTKEDVEHIDLLIAEMMEHTEGLTSMPGIETARNKIAVQVGIPEADEGTITWELVRETDYGSVREPPTSDYGNRDDD